MSQTPSLNEDIIEEAKPKTRRTRKSSTPAEDVPEAEKKSTRSRKKKSEEGSTEADVAMPARKRRTKKTAAPADEEHDETIHIGSALVMDDILPPATLSPAESAAEEEDSAAAPARKRRTRRSTKAESSEAPAESPAEEEKTAKAPARRTRTAKRSRPKDGAAEESAPSGDNQLPASGPQEIQDTLPASEEQEESISIGSALVLDDMVPPSSLSQAQEEGEAESPAEAAGENNADIEAIKKERRTPRSRKSRSRTAKEKTDAAPLPSQGEPGNQAPESAPVPADDLGNRADEQQKETMWPEDDGIVTSILPAEGPFSDVRSHRRNNPRSRRKRDKDAQPMSNGSPYLPDPYQQDFYPPLAGMDGEPSFGNRKSRNGRGRLRRNAQGIPSLPEDFDFNAAMLNDSVLGVALGRHEEEFLPEDDGPQPVLPDQPVALPPFGEESEEDLDALDAAVNGNRIDTPRSARDRQTSRKGRNAEKPKGGEKARNTEKAKNSKPVEAVEETAPATRRVLYISSVPDEQVEVAITEDGQVTEYFVEMAHQVKIRGNIYKGVINNIDTNLQAAFVNFGCGKNGFLQIDEVHPEYYLVPHDPTHGPKYPPIQKVLKVGQEVLVQVVKEPSGSKGAFLTTWVSIAGRFLVLTPGQEQIGVSRKVEDPEERARLKDLLNGIQPGENMGVIIRTASEGASKASIQQDMQYLKVLWKDIRKRVAPEKSPCLIYQEADLVTRSVRDYLSEDIEEIWTDDEAIKARVEEIASLIFPDRAHEIVKLHKDQRQTLWDRFNLSKQLESVTSREVVLPSGGRLVFDQTEALMAIDINSGKTQGKTNFEAMVFRTNMEAAETIARHLRLRDIGGQVVIDFIEMRDKNHCREVERTLRNAMRRDRARHDVGHMSSFGLLELVRQRTGTSAISISCEPCPHCHGTGVRRNMEWQALQSLRDLQSKLYKASDSPKNKKDTGKNGNDLSTFTYESDTELALYLLNRKRDRLAALEEKFGVHIEIRPK